MLPGVPEVTRRFFETIDPRPPPAPVCVFKSLSQFTPGENPEVVIFFARGEVIGGLHQLATFVTNDFEAVMSPFGARVQQHRDLALEVPCAGTVEGGAGGLGPFGPGISEARRNHLRGALGDVRPDGDPLPGILSYQPTWALVRKKIELSRKVWKDK